MGLPHVPVRQWVLTVPWRLRWRLARDPKALRAVIDIAIGEIRSFYERRGTSTGAITVVQRFGSKLNLNVHLHVLFLDGAFEAGPRGRPVFRHGPRVTDDDVGALVSAIAERVLAALPPSEEAVDEDEPLALFQAASIQGRSALGELPHPQRLGARALPPLCAAVDGFNLHAGVTVRARDRQALERLCRYVGRPPLALGRVQELPDGRVSIALRRPWSDGTTDFVLTAAQLVERLIAGVPPPHANQVLYHGVLASRHRWRRLVAPRKGRVAPANKSKKLVRGRGVGHRPLRTRHLSWAALLWRVFEVDAWRCKRCGGPMKLRGIVDGPVGPHAVRQWLRARPPPVRVAVA